MAARGRILLRSVADDSRIARLARDHGPWAVVFHHRVNSWLDVNGNVRAEGYWLKANVFPRDPAMGPDQVEAFVQAIVDAELAVRYEADGLPYLHFPQFLDEQVGLRVSKERAEHPVPDGWTRPESRPPGRPSQPGYRADHNPDFGRPEAEVEGEVEVEAEAESHAGAREGAQHQRDPATRRAELDAMDQEAFITEVIRLANRGLAANEEVDQGRFKPIMAAHGTSRQVVHDWLKDGVPRQVIARTVYHVARAYRPNGRNKQISTLLYFVDPVREAWEEARSMMVEVPGGANHAGGRGRWGVVAGSEASQVRTELPGAARSRSGPDQEVLLPIGDMLVEGHLPAELEAWAASNPQAAEAALQDARRELGIAADGSEDATRGRMLAGVRHRHLALRKGPRLKAQA